MSAASENETWIIEVGRAVIEKQAHRGIGQITPLDRLIFCLWVADYSMRNAGDLDTAIDVYSDFQREGARLAKDLRLEFTHQAFGLTKETLQRQYFERFDRICEEIKVRLTHGT